MGSPFKKFIIYSMIKTFFFILRNVQRYFLFHILNFYERGSNTKYTTTYPSKGKVPKKKEEKILVLGWYVFAKWEKKETKL